MTPSPESRLPCMQIQTIGFLSHLFEKGIRGPFMILAPLSTLPNWVAEFQRFCPAMSTVLYHGSKKERAMLRSQKMKMGAPICFLSLAKGR